VIEGDDVDAVSQRGDGRRVVGVALDDVGNHLPGALVARRGEHAQVDPER
jgi:hypothetical protein